MAEEISGVSEFAEDEEDRLVAVIGMAGRFPGAADLEEFWANLAAGIASTEPPPAQDEFDAAFFGVSDGEALLLDPQQRVFLETCWSALEDAGYDPGAVPGAVGIYAGGSQTEYLGALRAQRSRLALASDWQLRTATGMDYLTSRVAYKLGLRGPAVTVQTACSTALVAAHLAGQALIGGDCDVALAGGVTVHLWSDEEPVEDDAGLVAPDGLCRAFDAKASGTVFANGAGVLVLKRLSDARRDGDHVRAVILGSAVNNDGTDKIGFTAPGVAGQAAVIRQAQLAAGVDPRTIGYVEAHGTGTPLGDPIEVAALTSAFGRGTAERGFCAIGSVKTNIGHVDAAAGAAGLIKTVLALEHGLIPPSLNFTDPNPEIDFAGSPFFVNTELRPWPRGADPRRAGVSALGFGGTNAHLIVEEAPDWDRDLRGSDGGDRNEAGGGEQPYQLLTVSGRSPAAAAQGAARLAAHLRRHREAGLADVAWTLRRGRRQHPHRAFAVAADHGAAAEQLAAAAVSAPAGGPVAFAFPGQGGQYPGLCRDLYRFEPAFRALLDECAESALGPLGVDLRAVLLGEGPDGGSGLYSMAVGQPAVFAVEYALGRLLLDWGLRPDVLVGHSLGGYAAACLAGVFTLPDAIALVVERGRLLESVGGGAMAAVPLPVDEVRALLGSELDLAVVNGPAQCVVAGPPPAVDELVAQLAEKEVEARRLRIPVSAHSRYVEPVAAEFERRVAALDLRAPSIPLLSETTGRPLSAREATDPAYWTRHLRDPVRFDAVLNELFAEPGRVIVEVGPGQALTGLVRRHPDRRAGVEAVPTLPHPEERGSDQAALLTAVGRLWAGGLDVDWTGIGPRRRVRLPTYPFQRKRYTVDPPIGMTTTAAEPVKAEPAQTEAAQTVPPAVHQAADPDDVLSTVAALFCQALGVPRAEPADSLFSLGGDSVIATQIVRLLRQAFPIALPLRAVFRNPTVAGLARHIEGELAAARLAHEETA